MGLDEAIVSRSNATISGAQVFNYYARYRRSREGLKSQYCDGACCVNVSGNRRESQWREDVHGEPQNTGQAAESTNVGRHIEAGITYLKFLSARHDHRPRGPCRDIGATRCRRNAAAGFVPPSPWTCPGSQTRDPWLGRGSCAIVRAGSRRRNSTDGPEDARG
jgi:hypothetical protein